MRKGVNGLSIIVAEQMELDPLSGALFLFSNRYRRILKGLLWDHNGFWLIQKRLEGPQQFPWPDTEGAVREITQEQLGMLLDGIDFWRAHQKLSYHSVL
jgi:transposase